MKKLKLNLCLFDGGAAAGTGAAAPGAEGTAGNGVGSQQQVVYGKQQEETANQEGNPTPKEQKQTLKALIESDADLKAELETMMQRRVKNSKAELDAANSKMQALDPLLATLYTRYGVEDGNIQGLTDALNRDNSYLEEEAEMKGLTVEQLAYVKQLEMQNMLAQRQQQQTQAQMQRQYLQQKWDAESTEVKALYPDFDFVNEINSNPTFEKLIRANFPVKDAYEFAHREEIETARQAATAAAMQKQITSNIKARQERPQEAGLKGQTGFITKADPSQLTSKDIKEIRRRVANGEKISF